MFSGGTRDVNVIADATNDFIALGGNFQIPNLGAFISTGETRHNWSNNFKKDNRGNIADGFVLLGTGSPTTESATGIGLFVDVVRSDVFAGIADGAIVSAANLTVDGTNTGSDIAISASGGSAKNKAINGVIRAYVLTNNTEAFVSDGAKVDVTSATIDANDRKFALNIAGSLATSDKTGFGGSAALNFIDRDVDARIGARYDTQTLTTPSAIESFTATGDVVVRADSAGDVTAVAVAASTPLLRTQKQADSLDKSDKNEPNKTRISTAVALALNSVTDDVRAYVRNVELSAKSLAISSTYSPKFLTISVGGAVASGEGDAVGAAGAVSANIVNAQIKAFVADANGDGTSTDPRGIVLTGENGDGYSLSVLAEDSSTTTAGSGVISVAWAGSESNLTGRGATDQTDASGSLGISLAINAIGTIDQGADGSAIDTDFLIQPDVLRGYQVQAYVDDADVTVAGTSRVNALITSENSVLSTAVAGALAVSNGSPSVNGTENNLAGAISAGLAFNFVFRDVVAYIAGGGATSVATIIGTSAAAADVFAVQARDESTNVSAWAFGAAVAFARTAAQTSFDKKTGAISFGIGIAINDVKTTIKSYVENADIDYAGDVDVDALASTNLVGVGVGIAFRSPCRVDRPTVRQVLWRARDPAF